MLLTRRIRPHGSFDLAATRFGLLGPGGGTARFHGSVHRHAARTRSGAVQLELRRDGETIVARAWGAGAAEELESLPRLLGLDDDADSFDPPRGAVRELWRRLRGLRLGSTHRVFEAVAPAVLGQRVTMGEARRSYHLLVAAFGEAAPGPPGLQLPPHPDRIAELAYEDLHRHGIERRRAEVLREVARRARRLEEIVDLDRTAAYRRLQAVPGVGPWTAAHVMGAAWGDRDAVPIGDFHLPNTVAWVLAGEPRGDDARMLELLEPFRPERRRAVLLMKWAGAGAPRYGPKTPVHDIRSH